MALSISGCSDTVPQSIDDLQKYPELKLFFDAAGEFKKGTANLDVGPCTLTFVRKDLRANNIFFEDLNQKAKTNGWGCKSVSENEWEYTCEQTSSGGSPIKYRVWIDREVGTNDVIITWNRSF